MDYRKVQSLLRKQQLDGWLLYDFEGTNPVARRLAPLPEGNMLTRRWIYWIPALGQPAWLVHRIEAGGFRYVGDSLHTYISWRSWQEGVRSLVGDAKRIAVEYSPGNAIPYVSYVDAGTVEMLRSLGLEVVSSADLVQAVEAVLSMEQLASHRRAAAALLDIKSAAFDLVHRRLQAQRRIGELEVQRFIVDRFAEQSLTTNHPPIVGVNGHAADPHYVPNEAEDTVIRSGDFLLIDLWAKERTKDAVYGDITWVGYGGAAVPERIQHVFDIVRRARDAAVRRAHDGLSTGEPVYGYQVDDAARAVIREAGFGDFFIHRTGHNIGVETHGNGVNMDNLETQDRRQLVPGICFSVEPGIYLPEEGFGVRLEIDVYVHEHGVEVTTLPLQEEIIRF